MPKLLEISPSLFFQYASSPHWIWYDLHGNQSKKVDLPELTKRLIEGGVLHEENYVKDLQKATVDTNLSQDEAEKLTLQYMERGEELIYQGVISCMMDDDVKYIGRPDLLKKCSGASSFGDYYYIPVEIKNSIQCDRTEYKKQLMFYAIVLNKVQGFMPKFGEFINKNKERIPCDLTAKILKSTDKSIHDILSILRGQEPILQITKKSLQTPWAEVLLEEAKRKSDISLLYDINVSVLKGLKNKGIHTLSDMAACDVGSLPKIKGASIEALNRLKTQAISLINNEIIPICKPEIPDAETKIYFDIEGDPFLKVEYLFGFLIAKGSSKSEFKYFLAENPEDERAMWGQFLSWLKTENFKDFKVYHFNHYEKTQLNKLSKKYGTCDQLDQFIDNLVDLSKKLTGSFIFPVYFYSIKDIAKYLNFKWQHEKAGGAQSIFWYEMWLETHDRNILQDIIHYNKDDVCATEFLHEWLKNYKVEIG